MTPSTWPTSVPAACCSCRAGVGSVTTKPSPLPRLIWRPAQEFLLRSCSGWRVAESAGGHYQERALSMELRQVWHTAMPVGGLLEDIPNTQKQVFLKGFVIDGQAN